jgi:hypothetical protein
MTPDRYAEPHPTPDAFREDYDPPPDDEREDARADSLREAQEDARWWPRWAKAAGIHEPPPALYDVDRPF